MDAVVNSDVESVVSVSSSRLEADSAVLDFNGAVTGDATASVKTLSTVDAAKDVSVADGVGRHRSGNLSVVSEETGLTSLSHGIFFTTTLPYILKESVLIAMMCACIWE